MGIRKYDNKFRVAVSVNGATVQRYFETREEAQEYLNKMQRLNLPIDPWAGRSKKRCDACGQDLPGS